MSSDAVKPLDYLEIDTELDDDARDIRDNVAKFVRQRLLPEVPEWYERGTLPPELMRAFR